MTKGTWILIGILVALIIATYFVMQRTGELNTSATRDTMLVKFDSAAVRRIAIHGRAGGVVLEREGAAWVMVNPLRTTGDQRKVGEFLRMANRIELISTASTNPEKEGIFRVDSTGTRFVLTNDRGDSVCFVIGKQSESGGAGKADFYARKEGSHEVWLVESILGYTSQNTPSAWRDKQIFSAPVESIDRVRYSYGDTTFSVEHHDSVWTVDGSAANAEVVSSMLRALSNFQAVDFVDTAVVPMPKPMAAVEVQGKLLTFFPLDGKRAMVVASDNPQHFVVYDWTYSEILKRKKQFLR
jgi:hypothetical protein